MIALVSRDHPRRSCAAIVRSLFALALLLFVPRLDAQDLDRVCSPGLLATVPVPMDAAHPAVRYPLVEDGIAAGGARAFLATLRREVESALPVTSPLRRPFLAQLDSAIADVAHAERDPLAERRGIEQRFGATAQQGSFRFFTGSSDMVLVTASTPPSEARAACWTARLAQLTLFTVTQRALEAAALALADVDLAWKRWETDGWSLYPWESLVNGSPAMNWCNRDVWAPPRCTLVLGHASLGMMLSGPTGPGTGLTDWRAREEVVWDLLGLRTYSAEGRPGLGVVLFAIAPADEPPRWGAAISFGRLMQVGWAPARGSGVGAGRTGVMLSLDAFRALASVPEWVKERKAQLLQRADSVRAEIERGIPRPD